MEEELYALAPILSMRPAFSTTVSVCSVRKRSSLCFRSSSERARMRMASCAAFKELLMATLATGQPFYHLFSKSILRKGIGRPTGI